MDIPATASGVIKELKIKVGDKVKEGSLIGLLESKNPAEEKIQEKPEKIEKTKEDITKKLVGEPSRPTQEPPEKIKPQQPPLPVGESNLINEGKSSHASPSTRKFARNLGVNLAFIQGSGPKNRILVEDIQIYVKQEMAKPRAENIGNQFAPIPMPNVDFSKFGDIESKPLSKIKKISGANLHRNWVTAPHVTQFDNADITDLEVFRKNMQKEADKKGVKLTLLAFLIKACVNALKAYPVFNSSLSPDGEELILKDYYNIGFACDTPDGLVVPVVKDALKKDVLEIAEDLGKLSSKARERKLKMDEMQGGTFSISSLGGIGGTKFTPIINCPEVAILGVGRSQKKQVLQNGKFQTRIMLPLSLSYDHRIIDGAEAARFNNEIKENLGKNFAYKLAV